MAKTKIIYRKRTDLVPYKRNPRKNERAVEKVKTSIEKFGFLVPILIDSENEIVAGHTRWIAAEELGLENVPCIVLDGLDENQKKKYRIIDNKTAELSSWDYGFLAQELAEIGEIDMSAFDLQMKGSGADTDEDLEDDSEMDYDSNLDEGVEIDLSDFDDEVFENECPYCGFRWNE